MKRIKIKIEYDGTDLVGWQAQDNGVSVQSLIEKAVYAFSQEQVKVWGAGRTDAGVHALGQVAHFDLNKTIKPEKVKDALNAHLKNQPVVILESEEVSPDFHARFSAKWRKYIYQITNRRAPLVILARRAWRVPVPLNETLMVQAAEFLIGKHDFSSFRASNCQAKSPLKTLDYISINRSSELITLEFRAKSFLYHMVRNMVGTLKLIGEGKLAPQEIQSILLAKDRRLAGATAPPEGLYLTEIGY